MIGFLNLVIAVGGTILLVAVLAGYLLLAAMMFEDWRKSVAFTRSERSGKRVCR